MSPKPYSPGKPQSCEELFDPEPKVLKLRKVEFTVHSVGRVSRPDQKSVEIDGPGDPSCEKVQLEEPKATAMRGQCHCSLHAPLRVAVKQMHVRDEALEPNHLCKRRP